MKVIPVSAMLLALELAITAQAYAKELQLDTPLDLNGHTAILTKLDNLPYFQSDYSQRFKFDSFSNPKLRELREHYELDKVVAPGKDEFDRQVRLMDWTHHQFKKFGRPSTLAKGAYEILKAIDEGHSFFCTQYGQVMVSTAACLGWVDRALALRRHQGVNKNGGSTEHTTTEIWSNQYRKWVMLDPTSNMYLEKDGVPLNAWEIRQDWFYNDGKGLTIVVGKERKRYKKSDLPIWLAKFDGFGDLTIDPDELDKYGFIGYITNTRLTDSGYDYGGMFIVKDQLCDGTQWHTRKLPENPATDPYFPIGQSAMTLTAENGKLMVTLKTLTPNFKRFEARTDSGKWNPSTDKFDWVVHAGANRLEARTVNAFGIIGSVSTAEIQAKQ
jgi:hypothetical protein